MAGCGAFRRRGLVDRQGATKAYQSLVLATLLLPHHPPPLTSQLPATTLLLPGSLSWLPLSQTEMFS